MHIEIQGRTEPLADGHGTPAAVGHATTTGMAAEPAEHVDRNHGAASHASTYRIRGGRLKTHSTPPRRIRAAGTPACRIVSTNHQEFNAVFDECRQYVAEVGR